jgi:hypothetical protein
MEGRAKLVSLRPTLQANSPMCGGIMVIMLWSKLTGQTSMRTLLPVLLAGTRYRGATRAKEGWTKRW